MMGRYQSREVGTVLFSIQIRLDDAIRGDAARPRPKSFIKRIPPHLIGSQRYRSSDQGNEH